jgi:hypothetical protein
VTLLTAPIELAGDWGHMLPRSADAVVERMRHACLDGVPLVSDRQPARLRVDEHHAGLPHIWLHSDLRTTAWIVVDIGERDWSKLAYQFGHEFGHVLCNSWQQDAKPSPPCQWLEEAMVEAVSLRGLARLAESWLQDPPFPGDNAFGGAIAEYRQNIVARYVKLEDDQGGTGDLGVWFERHRAETEAEGGLGPFARAVSLSMLAEYEAAPECVASLGALNRWPGRSSVPLPEYLRLWEASCAELRVSERLPKHLRQLVSE